MLLQPSPQLVASAARIEPTLAALRGHGLAVLELPISPALGDRPGLLELDVPTATLSRWPDPLLLTELISGASGVIGVSLHLSTVAAALGVPVSRPTRGRESKYAVLDGLPGVTLWPGDGTGDPIPAPVAREPGAAALEAKELELRQHWDAVVGCMSESGAPRASVSRARRWAGRAVAGTGGDARAT